jgi:hypothetical protein
MWRLSSSGVPVDSTDDHRARSVLLVAGIDVDDELVTTVSPLPFDIGGTALVELAAGAVVFGLMADSDRLQGRGAGDPSVETKWPLDLELMITAELEEGVLRILVEVNCLECPWTTAVGPAIEVDWVGGLLLCQLGLQFVLADSSQVLDDTSAAVWRFITFTYRTLSVCKTRSP